MRKIIVFLIFVMAATLLFTGCQSQFVKESSFRRTGTSADSSGTKRSFTLVCWNVQTFFDAVTTGTEYKDFKNSERWNKEKYVKRMNKLCEVMTSLNPDIFVMEEIENDEVVQDIANTLAGGSWDNKKNWQYACFAKESGSAIGCAVFSRYEIVSLKTHSLDIQTQGEAQPSSRPLMQVTVCIGDREVELFVNHWKSKSGGEEETEIWRDWQELVLCDTAEAYDSVIMCGDFNRNAEDFITAPDATEKFNTVLRGTDSLLNVYSPWFRSDGKLADETGSYFYSGEWERIDNIFVLGNASITSFSAIKDSPLADEDGIPVSYKIYTGEGCSDHLPLKCVISVSDLL